MNFAKTTIFALGLGAAILPAAAQTAATDSGIPVLPYSDRFNGNFNAEVNYAVGLYFGQGASNRLKAIDIAPNWTQVEQGFHGRLISGAKLTDTELREVESAFQAKVDGWLSKKHHAEGYAFREQFKAQPAVTVTDSGLIYKVLAYGNGPKPTINDMVTLNYSVSKTDGTIYDSGHASGAPAKLAVGSLVRGWAEALQLMPVGSHWQIVIPPGLAYGEVGRPPQVGAGETLIFDVTLLGTEPSGDKSVAPVSPDPNLPDKTESETNIVENPHIPYLERFQGDFDAEISYTVGANFGQAVSNRLRFIEIDPDWSQVEQAFDARLIGAPKLTDPEMQEVINAFQDKWGTQLSKKHHAEGDKFRKDFAARPHVTVLDSGISYQIEEPGSGPKPSPSDTVTINYTISKTDGTIWDDSRQTGRPAKMALSGLIPGWAQAMEQMPVGSRWKIVIPPELGYGERGLQPQVGPGETLVWDIKLLGTEPTPDQPVSMTSPVVKIPSLDELRHGAKPEIIDLPAPRSANMTNK